MDTPPRRMWLLLEPLHAVVYFADEAIGALRDSGLRGFWMGYFAGRAGPMGAVAPAVVEAAFCNFAPAMVRRALPDAWERASPARVLTARLDGARRALERVLLPVAEDADVLRAVEILRQAVDGLPVAGRPLAAANLALPVPDDPIGGLWQLATTLREHRGDGHVTALVEAELAGCEALVTIAAAGGPPRALLQAARGWSDEEWQATEERLRVRGLLAADGTATPEGRMERDRVEAITDRLAAAPWVRIGDARTAELATLLAPLAAAVWASGLLPEPNPMGLPAA